MSIVCGYFFGYYWDELGNFCSIIWSHWLRVCHRQDRTIAIEKWGYRVAPFPLKILKCYNNLKFLEEISTATLEKYFDNE